MRVEQKLRICAAFVCVCVAAVLFPAAAGAQSTTVSASYVGGSSSPAASATIYFQPVAGCSIGASIGAARQGANLGQIKGLPYTATVTSGATSVSIPDALQATPAIAYAATAIDNITGAVLFGMGLQADGLHVTPGGPYGCLQPTGSTWNLDTYVPGSTAVMGSPLLNWRGAWASGTSYAAGDAVSYNGSSYASTIGGNLNNPGTPAAPGSGWSLLSAAGAAGSAGVGTDAKCHTDGSGNLTCSNVAVGSSATPSYPASVSANGNAAAPLQYGISRYGRASAEELPNLARLIGTWFVGTPPTTPAIILGAGDSRGVGATLPDAINQAAVSRFTSDLNSYVQVLGGQGPVFQAVNISVNGSVANQFPAALIAYQQYAPYSVTIHTPGSGYVVGDVVSLNQNSTANSALWKVTAVSAGVPTAIAPTPYVNCITLADTSAPSTGLYSVATNVPTANNNGICAVAVQNGTGTGLTVDINSVGWPAPIVTLFKYGINSSGGVTFNAGGQFSGEQKAMKSGIQAMKALGSDVVVLTNSMGSWSWSGQSGAPLWGSSTIGCTGASPAFMSVCSSTPTANVVDVVASTTVKDFAGLGVPVAANSRLLAIDQMYRSVAATPSFSADVIDEELNYFEQLEQQTAAATPITFTASAASGSTSLTVSAATNLHYASVIQCAGVPANDFATAVSGTTVTLAYATTATVPSGTACSSPNQTAAEQYLFNVAGPHTNINANSVFEWNAIDKFVLSFARQDGQRAPAGVYPLQTYDNFATVYAPTLNYVVPNSSHSVTLGTPYTITLPPLTSGRIDFYEQAVPFTSATESRYFNTCNTLVHVGPASGTNATAATPLFTITVPSGTDPGTGIIFTPLKSGLAEYVLGYLSGTSSCKSSGTSTIDSSSSNAASAHTVTTDSSGSILNNSSAFSSISDLSSGVVVTSCVGTCYSDHGRISAVASAHNYLGNIATLTFSPATAAAPRACMLTAYGSTPYATITMKTQPSASDTITVNGTAITFVASGATGNQVNIGAGISATMGNLYTFLSGSADANLSKSNYVQMSPTSTNVIAMRPVTNAFTQTLAASVAGNWTLTFPVPDPGFVRALVLNATSMGVGLTSPLLQGVTYTADYQCFY